MTTRQHDAGFGRPNDPATHQPPAPPSVGDATPEDAFDARIAETAPQLAVIAERVLAERDGGDVTSEADTLRTRRNALLAALRKQRAELDTLYSTARSLGNEHEAALIDIGMRAVDVATRALHDFDMQNYDE